MVLGEEFIVFIYRGKQRKPDLEQGCALFMAAELRDDLLISVQWRRKRKKSKHCNKSQ